MFEEVTPKQRQIKIHLRSLSDRHHLCLTVVKEAVTQLALSQLPGSAFIFWAKLAFTLSFPTFLPSQGEVVAAPVCLNFHLFECISAGAFEANSPQRPGRAVPISSLCLPLCPANPGLASGTTVQSTSWRLLTWAHPHFPSHPAIILIPSKCVVTSESSAGELSQFSLGPPSQWFHKIFAVAQTCWRHKQDAAWSPLSLWAIKAQCHRLHQHYPEYAFGFKYMRSH